MPTHRPTARLAARLAPTAAAALVLLGAAPAPTPQDDVPAGHSRVEVVDAQGTPVAVAGLYLAEETAVSPFELEKRGIADQDWTTKVSLLGREVRTDRSGEFDVPRPEEHDVLVLAFRDSRYYCRTLRAGSPGPHTLTLRDTTPLRVRLTDASGAPLEGGEVTLRANDGLEEFDLTTAPVSSLDNLAHLFSAGDYTGEVEAGYRLTVAQVGVFRNVPEVEVDLLNPPDAAIALTGRPTGTIELKVVGTNGQPLPGEIEVRVLPVREQGDTSVPAPPVQRLTDTGAVTLPHIGLGLDLEIEIQRPYSQTVSTFELTGPTKAGQVVQHRIEYPEKDVLLMGRVLGPDGEPMVDEYVNVYFETGNFLLKGKGVMTVRTRSDGRIQFPLVCRGRDAIQWAKVNFVREVEETGLHLERGWQVDEVTEAGIVRLGDLRLE